MTRTRAAIAFAVVAFSVCVLVGVLRHHGKKAESGPEPVVVRTQTVREESLAPSIDASGKVEASITAEVRPQASGILRSVHVKDGEFVREGAILFSIDEQPLRASVAQARAQYSRDAALAVDAEQNEARLRPLLANHYVSEKDYQYARNSMLSLRATADASKALVDEAVISLGYAKVRSPISGRAGAVLVKVGNLVSASQSTPLLVLNVASPAEVEFSVPQQQVDLLRDGQRQHGSLAVVVLDAVSSVERARGTLTFTDNSLDEASGTLAMRARFPNEDEALWPGEFVTVRVLLGPPVNVVAIAESALQQGQNGPYVFCVRKGKAVLQRITVDRVADSRIIVRQGISPGDEVIVTVPTTLREGASVRAEQADPDSNVANGSAR